MTLPPRISFDTGRSRPAPQKRSRAVLASRPFHYGWRISASLVRLAVARVAPGSVLPLVPFYDRRIVADLRTPTGLSLYRYGSRDPDLDLVRHLSSPGDVVIDCGANIGLFSVAAALSVEPQGLVYAFEPVGRVRRLLVRNVVASDCNNIVVLPFALGASIGRREFVTMPGGGGLSSFSPEMPEQGVPVMVDVHRLDDAVAPTHRHRVRLIKLDVEGAETSVLSGARQVIAASRPAILIEVEDGHLRRQGSSAAELRQLLEELGYRRADGPAPPNELYLSVDH